MLRPFLYLFNGLLLILLLLACLSCYISPAKVWFLPFLGLAFPLIVVSVISFALLWAIGWRKIFWLNIIVLLLSMPMILTVVAFHPSAAKGIGLKLMTYNVKNFDLYNWTGNKETRMKIMQLIAAENPDIICFQEYYTDDVSFFNTEYLRDSLGYKYHFVSSTFDKYYKPDTEKKLHHLLWGLAIFSKYEITDTGVLSFGKTVGNKCIYADLKVNAKSFRLYNTHLQSIHLGYDDYDTIEEISENQNTNWYRVKNILRKMKRASSKRAAQAQAVARAMQLYEGSKIICGDFNDAPVSFAYHTISSGLQDAFIEKGRGFGKSFANKFGWFRIDYILTAPTIKINSYRSIPAELSDHYPVVVSME